MRIRQISVHALFALLLLVSQQMAVLHAISHLSTANHSAAGGKQLPADKACDQCLAFAQLDAGLNNPTPVFAADRSAEVTFDACPMQSRLPRTICAFHSRAPPLTI